MQQQQEQEKPDQQPQDTGDGGMLVFLAWGPAIAVVGGMLWYFLSPWQSQVGLACLVFLCALGAIELGHLAWKGSWIPLWRDRKKPKEMSVYMPPRTYEGGYSPPSGYDDEERKG